jgi:hypothetical protein
MMEQVESIGLMQSWTEISLGFALFGLFIALVGREWEFLEGDALVSLALRGVSSLMCLLLIFALYRYHQAAHRFECLQRPFLLELGDWTEDRKSDFFWEWHVVLACLAERVLNQIKLCLFFCLCLDRPYVFLLSVSQS